MSSDAQRQLEKTADMLYWGGVFVWVWNFWLAPLRWILGCRELPYNPYTCMGGYAMFAFGYIPMLLPVFGILQIHYPHRGLAGEPPYIHPLISFVLGPILVIIFLLIMKLESRRRKDNIQYVTNRKAEIEAEIEALEEEICITNAHIEVGKLFPPEVAAKKMAAWMEEKARRRALRGK